MVGSLGWCDPPGVPEPQQGSPESSDGEEGEPWVGGCQEKGGLELSVDVLARSRPSLVRGEGHLDAGQ